MRLVFGEWTPDITAIAAPGLTDARNVIPSTEGYDPLGSLSPKTEAVAAKVFSGAWFLDAANNSQTFAGAAAKLYKRNGSAWTDVSGATYTGTYWEFAKWGNTVIACNYTDATQTIDMTSGTNFAALSNAPKARRVAVVKDFVVFGDTVESAVSYPNRIRWSGFNNATLYGSDLSTQADYQDLVGSGGRIQRIVSGSVGVIFMQHSIWYMTYDGPPTVFRFEEVEPGRGTPAAKSVCWFGSQIYFYSHDGFYVHQVGQGSRPIGSGKVDRWFLGRANPSRMDEMHGVVDRENNRVIWAFASVDAGANCDTILIYDVASGKWSNGGVEVETLVEVISPGYNLDTIGAVVGNIDEGSINMDTRAYLGGALLVAAFDSAHKLSTFDGDALVGRLTTGDVGGESRMWVHRVRPIVNSGSTMAVRIGSRRAMADPVVWSPWAYPNASGVVPLRINNRLHRFRLLLTGGFGRAVGLDVDISQGGTR
jgi:hypothetical protein